MQVTDQQSQQALEPADESAEELAGDPESGQRPRPTRAARPQRRAPATRELVLAAAGFLILALVAYLPAWLHGPANELAIGSGKDNSFGPWWMQWDAWALVHGANPFYSHFLNAPTGVNLMLNPVTHAIGYLLAPVTLLFGPIASWNVAMTLGIAANGLAGYLLLRRFVSWWAAVPGALVYGFGPYVVAQGLGHINFVIVPVPPLLLWLAYHLLVDEDARPVRSGIAVGLLAAVQLLISPEVLAQTAIIVAIGGFLWLSFEMRRHARRWPERLIRLAKAAAVAVATAVPLVAYPVWMLFDGPQHVHGPASTVLRLFRSDLSSAYIPTSNQLIGPEHWKQVADSFLQSDVENGAYLGFGLLAVLFAGVVWQRRRRVVQVTGAMLVISYVLTLGNRLQYLGTTYKGTPLPFAVLDRLVFGQDFNPPRFGLWLDFFAAVLLAVILDRIGHRLRERRSLAVVSVAAVALTGLVPLLPNWPYQMVKYHLPQAFADGGKAIPAGAVVLTYPLAMGPNADAELWQAEDNFRFSLAAGYFSGPAANGRATYRSGETKLDAFLIFYLMSPGHVALRVTPAAVSTARRDLRSGGVTTVVVDSSYNHADSVARLFERALGSKPARVGSDLVFYDVQADLAIDPKTPG